MGWANWRSWIAGLIALFFPGSFIHILIIIFVNIMFANIELGNLSIY